MDREELANNVAAMLGVRPSPERLPRSREELAEQLVATLAGQAWTPPPEPPPAKSESELLREELAALRADFAKFAKGNKE